MKKEVEQIEETKSYPHKSLEAIEEDRIVFLNRYKKHNNLKLVVVIICFIAILVAFIFIPKAIGESNPKLSSALTVIIPLVFLGGGLGYSIFVRKYIDKKMHDYFQNYFGNVNSFVFDSKEYSEVALQDPGKITVEQFNECKLYKDIVSVGSRALTKFKFHDIDMEIVETAGNVKKENNRVVPVFVGKAVVGKAKYKGDEPIVVYLKGNDRSLPPTNLEGIEKVEDNEQLMICTNCITYKKVLTKEVMTKIKAIKTNKNLVDLAISIYSEKVFVMMGYDDPLMVLPLQKEFDSKPVEMFKKDMVQVCSLIEELGK